MAAGFGHRWQGQTLGSLPRRELISIARLLGTLLEEARGYPAEPEFKLAALPTPDLILHVWRLDLRLDRLRPLGPSSPRASRPGTPSASSSNRSGSDTRTAPALLFGVFGETDESPVE